MRIAFFGMPFAAIALGATVIGCGGPGAMHSSLVPSPVGVTAAIRQTESETAGEAALDATVVRAHREIAGNAVYGVLDGQWVAAQPLADRPGYYSLLDGEVVPDPPSDSYAQPAETLKNAVPLPAQPGATSLPTVAPNCSSWSGNTPPSCTNTGPFRRVYTGPGYSYALAHVTLPAPITTMPKYPPLHGDTGFVYFEGWPGPGTDNSEFGFQYSPDTQSYALYARTTNPAGYYFYYVDKHPIRYLSGQTVTLAVAGYTIGTAQYLHMSAIGQSDVTCGSSTLCLAHGHERANGWFPSACCIMARMTSIGQKNPYGWDWFYDGVSFGPIAWSNAHLAQNAPTPAPNSTTLPFANAPAWTSAGSQNWPPNGKVSVAYTSATAETDTINLSALPNVQVAMSPSGCQYDGNKSSVKVQLTAAMTGNAGSTSIEYGWSPADNNLSVPNATENDYLGMYVGPNATSATFRVGLDGYGAVAATAGVNLLYWDARGNLASGWYSPMDTSPHNVQAGDTVAIGAKNLCPSPKPQPTATPKA